MPELRPERIVVWTATNEHRRPSDAGEWDFTCKGIREQKRVNLGRSGADCTLQGFHNILRVERKEVNDLIQSLTNERERFENQLKFMRQFPWRVVIVEWASLSTLLDGLGRHGHDRVFHSRAHWNGVRGSILHLSRRYCPFVFAGSREEARDYAWDFMFGVAEDWWKTYQSIAPEN